MNTLTSNGSKLWYVKVGTTFHLKYHNEILIFGSLKKMRRFLANRERPNTSHPPPPKGSTKRSERCYA